MDNKQRTSMVTR